MELFSIIALSAFVSLASSLKLPFNDVFSRVFAVYAAGGEGSPYGSLGAANEACMREKLRLDTNGDKLVDEGDAAFAVESAGFLCITDPEAKHNEIMDMIFKAFANIPEISSSIDCFKERLLELQPNSDLLAGFEVNNEANCTIVADLESGILQLMSDPATSYSVFNIDECLALDANQAKIDILRIIVLIFTQHENEAVVESEKQATFKRKNEIKQRAVKCILEKIEKAH